MRLWPLDLLPRNGGTLEMGPVVGVRSKQTVEWGKGPECTLHSLLNIEYQGVRPFFSSPNPCAATFQETDQPPGGKSKPLPKDPPA